VTEGLRDTAGCDRCPPTTPPRRRFLVRAEGVNGRNWQGDEGGGLLVTYRSIGNVKYRPHPRSRAIVVVVWQAQGANGGEAAAH
jgi:hypothetical protein